ncbi:alpha/beta hydrolase [Porticoccus sp. GXU_MW_L64]
MPDFTWPHRLHVQSSICYGSDDPQQQQLDIYSQNIDASEQDGKLVFASTNKTLVFIHGGGWVEHDRINHSPWLFSFLEAGWNVVNLEYRLGPNTAPQAVEDVLLALQWLADNGRDYGIDCHKLVVGGCSAGGHLALIGSYLTDANLNITCVMNWCGITDIAALEHFLQGQNQIRNYALQWAGDNNRLLAVSEQYSPIRHVNSQTPPTVTVHGDADIVVPFQQAEKLHELLEQQGVDHHLVTLTDGGHGGFTPEQWSYGYREVFAFINRHI